MGYVTGDALGEQAGAWLALDPDPVTREELQRLIDSDREELARRFASRLEFGTAGLRGPLGAGPARMNQVVVRRAAAGLVQYLLDTGTAAGGLVVGHDARWRSDAFALDTARVAAARGVPVWLLPPNVPTPRLAFAVRELGAAAGVMVTASHNPRHDNGYKVYLGTGAQIVPPVDQLISDRIDAQHDVALAAITDPLIERIDWMAEAYLDALARTVPLVPDARQVRVAYSALHGVAGKLLLQAFQRCEFAAPVVVLEQQKPDPDFPTVSFPNPEEPGTMDRVIELAQRHHCDIALANDPDGDRMGVALPQPDGTWRMLRGDEIGWLLADHVLNHTTGDDRLVVTTIVSSSLLSKMAAAAGVGYAETLTGFKWIAEAIRVHPDRRFVFGYEQALGYLVGTTVRDKDGIGAAVALAEAAALARRDGYTLQDRLDQLGARFGRHLTVERSLALDLPQQQRLMDALRAAPPTQLQGYPVTEVVDRSDGNVIKLQLGTMGRVFARPSGTEPKLKLYAELIDHDPNPVLDELVTWLRE
jgi:phosphomannomutase